MEYEIGKVTNYNGVQGSVITTTDNYLLLDKDIEDEISNGDIVRFRGEEVQGIKRAFFVKKLPTNVLEQKIYRKENN